MAGRRAASFVCRGGTLLLAMASGISSRNSQPETSDLAHYQQCMRQNLMFGHPGDVTQVSPAKHRQIEIWAVGMGALRNGHLGVAQCFFLQAMIPAPSSEGPELTQEPPPLMSEKEIRELAAESRKQVINTHSLAT